ncbi:precorrin-2/cobalt-factor-2 C20-methyltransferase [Caminicella sporogenes DSM 14501]|uniref:Precorrin-2/cobalt-factor-2 C20-methyltransferase n=1 Tax=Caminicella sporogenes DSM 14501 TaxID=1121266 RepID=A0A1M6MUS5_9FIRM|nr:precorrin-2 C(20)-methyltransferase [Caminicella sporogenes]RKD22497.1 precorrin-2 C(20)-methyltransferase [Caminicella sporogenes]SHJ87043.1 precorrin-2/cobalt-factor-2 C20-methyltransferase [Caminicella sporogenes DSM 14501]
MKKGKFYGVGVGPGDSELITVKAKRILNEVDVVICPEKRKSAGSFAYDIAKEHIKKDVKIIYLTFPMIYDENELQNKWEENALIIAKLLNEGKSVAFITLGDPTVYSTYMYLLPYLKKYDVEVETIPGITSFCSVAGSLNIPIVEWEEGFSVVPLRKGDGDKLIRALDNFENVIVMKPSNDCKILANELIKRGLENNFILISKCGTEEERVITDIDIVKSEKIPYLSTMIIKKNGLKMYK